MKLSSYKVNPKHRAQKPKEDCTQWTVSEWVELNLFVEGQKKEWVCGKNNVWSIEGSIGNYTEIGNNGTASAYMAKYVTDHNGEWHGYPVVPSRQADRPPTTVLDSWKNSGIINKHIQSKITKGKW
ncbi:hypothetical protein [Vibrio cholerae]|mgnify:CR=1 FL=1